MTSVGFCFAEMQCFSLQSLTTSHNILEQSDRQYMDSPAVYNKITILITISTLCRR